MPGRFYIKTFGCQMNEYDSARMADVLGERLGLTITQDPAAADLLLMNTCSVREKAQEKVFSLLGEWRLFKAQRPEVLIGVGGCVASQEGEAIWSRAPFVDLVFGPQTIHRLPDMVSERRALLAREAANAGALSGPALPGAPRAARRALVDVSFPEIEKFDRLPEPTARGASAFVSVMEGCSKYCSYCVVPYTRGDEISRPFDSVLAEIRALAAQGVSEVTLLGQNVNAYAGAMSDGAVVDLATLIHHVACVEGIERVRFTTSHPLHFTDSLIEAYASVPALANHLHLPVQSGSDRVLARMKRGYTACEYRARIRALRAIRPDIAISTDIIVGFPGETEQDFEATLQLVADVGFDQSFSFLYSARPGTPAASLPDEVSHEAKQARLVRLQALLDAQALNISRAMVGSTQRVLVARRARRDGGELAGRTENNRWVNFAGPVALLNRFAAVTVTEAMPHSLRGRLQAA